MSSRTGRLVAVTAVVLLSMAVTTGSTQAQQGSPPGGALSDLPISTTPAPEQVRHLPARPMMCEEFMHADQKRFKG